MKRTNENKNLEINRVEDNSKPDNLTTGDDKIQKIPPQPLTRQQLEYYHKAREQALKRKTKTNLIKNSQNISKQKGNMALDSNDNEPARRLMNRSQDISLNNSKKTVNHLNNEAENQKINTNKNLKQDIKNKKREQEIKRAEHLRKQAYYDSKYADETEVVEYYEQPTQERNKSGRFIGKLFQFVSWLIFFIFFIIAGYFLAKFILG